MAVSILLAFFHHSWLGSTPVWGFWCLSFWYALVRISFAIGVHSVTKICRFLLRFCFSPLALTHAQSTHCASFKILPTHCMLHFNVQWRTLFFSVWPKLNPFGVAGMKRCFGCAHFHFRSISSDCVRRESNYDVAARKFAQQKQQQRGRWRKKKNGREWEIVLGGKGRYVRKVNHRFHVQMIFSSTALVLAVDTTWASRVPSL